MRIRARVGIVCLALVAAAVFCVRGARFWKPYPQEVVNAAILLAKSGELGVNLTVLPASSPNKGPEGSVSLHVHRSRSANNPFEEVNVYAQGTETMFSRFRYSQNPPVKESGRFTVEWMTGLLHGLGVSVTDPRVSAEVSELCEAIVRIARGEALEKVLPSLKGFDVKHPVIVY